MNLTREIAIFLIGWLIIIMLSGYLLGGPIVAQDPEEEAICKFPCTFPEPVYHLAVKSAKYEYLKTHGPGLKISAD